MRANFGIFVLAAVAICYSNSISNPFVQDDLLIVAENPEIRQIAPLHFLNTPYSQDPRFTGTYRPLTILSFSLDYAIWGNRAFGFRITNLLLHALNGFLVFALANALLGSVPAALAAAAFYVFHPVHTETVVGIVGRGELLAAAFMFSAWLLFRDGRTAWSALALFLGLLSKENVIIFPAVMMLDALLLRSDLNGLFREWRRYVVLILTSLAYLALRAWVLGGLFVPKAHQYAQGTLSNIERIMTTGRVFLQCLKLILLPVDVVGVYEFYSIPTAGITDWVAWMGLLLVAAAILVGMSTIRTAPCARFAILLFFVTLFPVSNWIIPIGAIMAERFLYTPLLAVALLAGRAWRALPSVGLQRLSGAGFLVISVLLCIAHNYIWRDEVSFYGNVVRVFPDNMSGRLGYGYSMLNKGRLPEAVQQFEAAHRIAPRTPTLLAQVAGAIVKKDPAHCDQARPLLDAALKEQPNHWESYWVLANCSALTHQWEAAEEFYRRAVENIPSPNADLLFSWGATLEASGKIGQAIRAYERALLLHPDDVEIEARLERLR